MELAIAAPHDGTVEVLELAPGDRVARRQPLVAVTSADEVGRGDERSEAG
jgi:biotin carboxyl carrier protein